VGIREGKVLTRIVTENKVKMQIGDEIMEVGLIVIQELLEKGLIQPYMDENGLDGWRITEEGEKIVKKLKGKSK
jgi:predicted transcriptional regulator